MNPEIIAEEKFDILGNLPKEICYKILFYLSPDDIANSFRCCKKWQQHINYKFVWKKINRGADSEEEPKSKVYQKMVHSYSVHGQGRNMYYRALQYNVKNQKYQKYRIDINNVDDFEIKCVHMDNCITILCTELKFYIINSSCGLVERTIKCENYFKALRNGNYLITITTEAHLKIWNIKDGTVVINKHLESNRYLKVIEACKDLIIFVNDDYFHEVYIFDIRTEEYKHISTAKYACCSKDLIAFLQNNGDIIIRDTDYHCVTSLNCSDVSGEDIIIDVMQMNEDFLVIEYHERYDSRILSIFNIKTKKNFNISRLSIRQSYFKISKNRLVFGTEHQMRAFIGYLQIWDMCTQNLLFKIDNVKYYIYSFILHNSCIYIKSFERKWQMWCLQTGKFVQELRIYAGDQEIIAITNSKLLFQVGETGDIWEIRDFEANLHEKKKRKNKINFNKKRKLTL